MLSSIPCAEFYSNRSRNVKITGIFKNYTDIRFPRKVRLLDNVLKRTPIVNFMGIQKKTLHLLVRGHGPKIGHTVGRTDERKELVCTYPVIFYFIITLKISVPTTRRRTPFPTINFSHSMLFRERVAVNVLWQSYRNHKYTLWQYSELWIVTTGVIHRYHRASNCWDTSLAVRS